MRTSLDYAREYLDSSAISKVSSSTALSDVIKKAMDEAYTQGTQDGMRKFFDIAVKSSTRLPQPILPSSLTEDPHDNMLMNLGQQA